MRPRRAADSDHSPSVQPAPPPMGRRDGGWSVVHTRGAGVRRVAELLSCGAPRTVQGDLRSALLASGAEMLVTRHLTSTDLVKQVAPNHVDPSQVGTVVGAIGTGPHARLVAEVAGHMAAVLDLPGRLIAASPDRDHDPAAETALQAAGPAAPAMDRLLLRVSGIEDLTAAVSPQALLVVGAPGGSWLQRQFFGPGRKLAVSAPAGALVVRDAPERCYQRLDESLAFGPGMRVEDALRLLTRPAAPVADDGQVVGIVRRSRLERVAPDAALGTVMEAPRSVAWDASIAEAVDVAAALEGAPVPVVDPGGRLIGEVRVR